MRTLLIAALFATGLSFTAPSLPIGDPELTIGPAGNRDGGKKKKDEEKEEDYARSLKVVTAPIS